MNHRGHRTLIRHAALDALRHQLVGAFAILEVAVGRALLHRAERAHAAVAFVRTPLIELGLAGRLLGAGEQATEHHRLRASGDGLGDITRIADTAISDQRHAGAFQCRSDVLHRGDLRHADTRDDARGANAAGADADLDTIGAVVEQRTRGIRRSDVAANHLHLRKVRLDPLDAVEHALRVPVCGVHHQHVGAGLDQQRDALVGALTHAHRRTDTQTTEAVLAGVRVLAALHDVLDRDQALERPVVADHQEPFQPMLVQQVGGHFQAHAFRHGHQALARRHDVAHRLIQLRLEAQVAVGDDAHHFAAVDHRETADAVLASQPQQLADGHLRADGDRILDHSRLKALDLGHLGRLLARRHVLVDDAQTTLLRQRDRQTGLGDRVHRRRNER